MTAIAILNHPETPVLLSDMLLSAPGSNSDIFLPALGDLNVLKEKYGFDLPFTATRMARKPFVINNKSLVAWAGDVAGGVALRKYLHMQCQGRHVTQEDIDTAFWNLPEINPARFSVISVSLPQHGKPDTWQDGIEIASRGCIEFESQLYGRCLFGGSGAQVLERFVRTRDTFHAKALVDAARNDPYALLATSLSGHLLFRESLLFDESDQKKLPVDLLNEACGGFYETYTLSSRGISAPKSTLYVYFSVAEGNEETRITRLYYYTSRTQGAMVYSLIAEPYVWPESGVVRLGDTSIDGVLCPPFYATKSHIHVRNRTTELFEEESNFRIDAVSAIFFQQRLMLAEQELQTLDEPSRLHAVAEPVFRHQQFVTSNSKSNPVAEIRFNQDTGLQVLLNPQWYEALLDRFKTATSTGTPYIDRNQ